jgi:hypothetical protein
LADASANQAELLIL